MVNAPAPPLHANCVAVAGRGLLIMGPSGCGKSALSLELMSRGAALVADDRVLLARRDNAIWASAPETTFGLIEARGIGVLNSAALAQVRVVAAVDLARTEQNRIPLDRKVTVLGMDLPLFYAVQTPHFAASLVQLMKAGISHR